MKVLVIDGQGGRLGGLIIQEIKKNNINCEITAIGTNGIATACMNKAGADNVATGENPVLVCTRYADYIIGPIGIVIADSLMGEITPSMSKAVAQSKAKRILIPYNKCDNVVVGLKSQSLPKFIEEAVLEIK